MTLKGYLRSDGSYGIRNLVAVLSTVQCGNTVVTKICEQTGASPVIHDHGCIESPASAAVTQLALIRAGCHPNVSGVLVVSLGCEQTNTAYICEQIRKTGKRTELLVIQDEDGMKSAVEKGVGLVREMQQEAQALERVEMPFEKLVVSVQCGGSDWTTALSGNAAIGAMSDIVAANGGAVVLSEISGFPGSEQILADNAASREAGVALLQMVQNVRESYLCRTGNTIESVNPTTGNKAGGITTLVEKSMGNVKKLGHVPLEGILELGEPVPHGGGWVIANYCEGPDSLNTSAFAMSGAHLTVFSSGRGTPIGNALMPVLKLTGNPFRYEKLRNFFDFNAGGVLEGEPVESVGKRLFDYMLAVANGETTIAEELGCREFTVPYQVNKLPKKEGTKQCSLN